MSLTTALHTGLTGLDVHSKNLDVIGNNITNVNTIGFKSSRAIFETQLSRNLGLGSAPNQDSGGSNPSQIGLGVKLAGTQRDMRSGPVQPTGVGTDVAIEGPGFFIVNQHDETRYTRDGSFNLFQNQLLVTNAGARVQGYGVDDNFNIVPGVTGDLRIPVGSMTLAEATRNVEFAGNLNAAGPAATVGTQITSAAMDSLATAGPADAATLLTDLTTDGTNPLFATGNVVTISGAEKGGRGLGTHTFEVGGANTTSSDANGTTLEEFMAFLNGVLGISGNETNAGTQTGVNVNANGQIVIEGDHGAHNNLRLRTTDVISNGSPSQPFALNHERDAVGESVRTSFEAFDSLGTPLQVDVTLALEEKSSGGTVWRYYAESAASGEDGRFLGSGTISFDAFGALTSGSQPAIPINREGTGAMDPMSITLDFASQGSLTALAVQRSELSAVAQDGTPVGVLEGFNIEQTGIITGSFTNGLTRTLGQVAMATFTNPEGLVDTGGNTYRTGANSGLPVVVSPLTFGAGRLISGALEQSNVDLSREFVELISTSTGYSASSRVISTSDQLIQQLIALGR